MLDQADKEIEIINEMIDCAIDHGGDCGGAYFPAVNHSMKQLKSGSLLEIFKTDIL